MMLHRESREPATTKESAMASNVLVPYRPPFLFSAYVKFNPTAIICGILATSLLMDSSSRAETSPCWWVSCLSGFECWVRDAVPECQTWVWCSTAPDTLQSRSIDITACLSQQIALPGLISLLQLPSVQLIQSAMGDLKHLVLVKFKDGVVVEEIMEGMSKLVSEMDTVKSFEWGQDVASDEMLRQGFTHVFLLTFKSEEDFVAYSTHPNHVEFSGKFAAAIEKVLLLHYPTALVKSAA